MVHLALVWHHHQPFYKDIVRGSYRMPWVRLHGIKDYLGMARLLERAGGDVRATINLVPSLIEQLDDYVRGRATDDHLELSARPAADLDEDERERALDLFFMANWDHVVRQSPRYGQLLEKRRPGRLRASLLTGEFSVEEYRDLQVWGNLAWFHRTVLTGDEDLAALVRKDRGFTEEEKAFVLASQREVLAEILPLHRKLAADGIVELTTTPYYHPILPLLVDAESARVALPGTPLPARRTALPEDARAQLLRAVEYHERVFGERPRGLWPSEGSVSPEILPLVREAGFSWLASDQEVLASSRRDSAHDDLYRPWRLDTPHGPLSMVFRDHRLSDLIGFDYQGYPPDRAARDMVERVRDIGRRHRHRPLLVTLVLDGENPWEHYPDGGVPFLTALYRELAAAGDIETVRVGDHLEANPPDVSIRRLHSGSWIHHNFAIWMGHEEDVRAWEYLYRVREDLLRITRERGHEPGEDGLPADLERAWRCLYVAEGSDWTWWYGDDHSSGQDDAFDDLYRTHLKNVYLCLSLTPPRFLDTPVPLVRRARGAAEPAALLRVTLDGRITSFFEWLSAGRYEGAPGEGLTGEGGAMSRAGGSLLREIRFGFDPGQLFLRLDLTPGWREALADREGPTGIVFRIIEPLPRPIVVADLLAESPAVAPASARVAIDDIVEVAVPFKGLGLSPGDPVAFHVELVQGGTLKERLPGAEALRFTVPGEDYEDSRWHV